MQESVLDDLDLRLIHAVQIAPRAPWAALAPVLDADPVTLARRWARLSGEGLVYVTGYEGLSPTKVMALIEIECPPQLTLDVAEELCREPGAVTIDVTAGGRDLIVTLGLADAAALSTWTLERVRSLEGIRSLRTHPVAGSVADARTWRLRALTKDEAAAVEAADPLRSVRRPRLSDEQYRTLKVMLAADGRVPAPTIADRLGISARRARDAIAALRADGQLVIRVDVARSYTPWPTYAWYFLRVPAPLVTKVGPALSRIEEVRLVVNAVGQYNVIMAVWLRTLADIGRLEAMIEERLPGVTIADRSLVLRTIKHLGHLLDERGHATGETVPLP